MHRWTGEYSRAKRLLTPTGSDLANQLNQLKETLNFGYNSALKGTFRAKNTAFKVIAIIFCGGYRGVMNTMDTLQVPFWGQNGRYKLKNRS